MLPYISLFLYLIQEAPRTKHGSFEGRAMIEACGKFALLEKMLDRLKKEGHRVLVFSQVRPCALFLFASLLCVVCC